MGHRGQEDGQDIRDGRTVSIMETPRLLTSSQVAAALGLSRRSIARYVANGWITPELITPGGQYRFDLKRVKTELRELSEQRHEQPPSDEE
jgi:hypothetical protein